MQHRQIIRSFLMSSGLALTVLTAAACSDSTNESDSCPLGAESCACTTGGACDFGLMCLSGVCVNPSPEGTGGTGEVGQGTGGTGDATASSAPTFLSVSTNMDVVTENDTLILTVVATDPDGIDDLVGGAVIDPVSGSAYGALTSAAAEGSYTLSLDWKALNDVATFTVPPGGSTNRAIRVQLFDAGGNLAEQDVNLILDCSSEKEFACTPLHCQIEDWVYCGSCTHSCSANEDCLNGVCIF